MAMRRGPSDAQGPYVFRVGAPQMHRAPTYSAWGPLRCTGPLRIPRRGPSDAKVPYVFRVGALQMHRAPK